MDGSRLTPHGVRSAAFFNNSEEVKERHLFRRGSRRGEADDLGKDCIVPCAAPGRVCGRHAATACSVCALKATLVFSVIGSSNEVHVVDALAITGDEGRCSLR